MTRYFGIAAALSALIGLLGCQQLPGSRTEQGTGIGTAAGAAVGAAVADDSLVGALLGGLAGAAGGYLVGARTDWFEQPESERGRYAQRAIEDARRTPATEEAVLRSRSADLNDDGFVTMDELLAMADAGLADEEIVDRLRATDQVFELTPDQRQRLRRAGYSYQVLEQMENINRERRDALLGRSEVVGRSR